MFNTDLTIVVCCNKKDFFLARICIASIRYYYPDIPIELVKDPGNGMFESKDLEKNFIVKSIDLGIERMGWSGAKFHYLFKMPKGKKILILDADIVFMGPFLERMEKLYLENDYVVSASYNHDPYSDWAKNTYFDTKKIELADSEYKFPGYFFNAGQMFLTVGSIDEEILNRFFDKSKFPYWKDNNLFPLVDQSVYNYLLPTLKAQNKLRLEADDFMIWGESPLLDNISLEKVANKSLDLGLVHWAGCLRVLKVSSMVRGDILLFFEDYYYSKIQYGFLKKSYSRLQSSMDYYLRKYYRKTLKKIIKRTYQRFLI